MLHEAFEELTSGLGAERYPPDPVAGLPPARAHRHQLARGPGELDRDRKQPARCPAAPIARGGRA
nr:hypothetical protein [Tanacetum cinerariifolium]